LTLYSQTQMEYVEQLKPTGQITNLYILVLIHY